MPKVRWVMSYGQVSVTSWHLCTFKGLSGGSNKHVANLIRKRAGWVNQPTLFPTNPPLLTLYMRWLRLLLVAARRVTNNLHLASPAELFVFHITRRFRSLYTHFVVIIQWQIQGLSLASHVVSENYNGSLGVGKRAFKRLNDNESFKRLRN